MDGCPHSCGVIRHPLHCSRKKLRIMRILLPAPRYPHTHTLFSLSAHMSPHDHRWPSCRRMESLVFRAQEGSPAQTSNPIFVSIKSKNAELRDRSWYFTVDVDEKNQFNADNVHQLLNLSNHVDSIPDGQQIFEVSEVAEKFETAARKELAIDMDFRFRVLSDSQDINPNLNYFSPRSAMLYRSFHEDVRRVGYPYLGFVSQWDDKIERINLDNFLKKVLKDIKEAVVAKKHEEDGTLPKPLVDPDATKCYATLEHIKRLVHTALTEAYSD